MVSLTLPEGPGESPAPRSLPSPKSQAALLWRLQAERGDMVAQHNFGCCLADVGDYEEAKRFFFKAARQGYGKSLFNLAAYYEDGRLPVDLDEAERLFELGAAQCLLLLTPV